MKPMILILTLALAILILTLALAGCAGIPPTAVSSGNSYVADTIPPYRGTGLPPPTGVGTSPDVDPNAGLKK